MKQLTKEQIHGIAGTIIAHLLLLLILLFVVIEKPLQQEEEGVPVVLGNVERAKGDAYSYTEVKVAPQPAPKPTVVKPVKSPADPLIILRVSSPDKVKKSSGAPHRLIILYICFILSVRP